MSTAALLRLVGLGLVLLLGLACPPAQDPLAEIRELQRRGRFAESIDPLRRLIDEDPSRAEANLMLGMALLRTGQAGLAVWPLRKASESDTYAVEAGLLLAQAMLQSRTAPDAVTALDRVLALEPENVDALELRVQAYLATSRPEAAVADAERVLELDPQNLTVLVPGVMALIAAGRIEEAEAALETARERLESTEREVEPETRARLCVARALFAFEKGEVETAEAQYAECLEEFPTQPLVVMESVAFHDRMGRRGRGTEILEQALEASGSAAFRVALARRMGALGDHEDEERLLREEAERRPSSASWFALADFYVRREQFDSAVAAFEKAVEASASPSAMLRFAYADTLVQAKQYERARRVARGLEQPELRHLIRGRILLEEGNAAAALAAFDAGIRLWPNNAGGRFLAAQAAERLGRFDRAIVEYRESLRANPAQTKAGLMLAPLSALRGDYEGALDAAGRYHRSHPRDPQGYLVSVRIAHEAGRPEIVSQGLDRLGRLPGQAARVLAQKAELVAAGPAEAVEMIEASGLDLTDPANAPALRALLTSLAALGDHARARERADQALAEHPEEAVLHELRGQALRAAGLSSRARQAFQRAVELEPDHAPALLALAELSAEAGEVEAAVALCDRALEAEPEEPAPALMAAELLIEAQRGDEAERRLTALLDRHPREGAAALILAELAANRGERERALDLAGRAAWLHTPGADAALERIRGAQGVSPPAASGRAEEPVPSADPAS